MNKLSTEKRCTVVSALVEGCSIRSTVRMTDVAKNTVTKLLVDLGQVCSEFQDRTLRNLQCKRLQLDEIWSFCYSKEKNVPAEKRGEFGYGDVWTWTAIDADHDARGEVSPAGLRPSPQAQHLADRVGLAGLDARDLARRP